jgi:pimeloyl-ACP methyl ester carboxylesterase
VTEFDDVPMLAARLGVTDAMRASRRGGDVSFVQWGDGEPEFLFFHGVGNDARSFDALALVLGRPAIAVDLPGHGHSSWRADADYSPLAIADDVLVTLRSVIRRPVVFVGHSLGGMTAARVARLAPDLVERLVLVDMTPDFPDRSLERVVVGLTDEPTFPDAHGFVAHASSVRPGESLEALEAEARHSFVHSPIGRIRRHHFPHVEPGERATIGSFQSIWLDLEAHPTPVLLVRGERGYVSPRLASAFASRLSDATVVTLPTRHSVHTTDPLGLARAISEWLTSSRGDGAAT